MRGVLVLLALVAGCASSSSVQCGEVTCPTTWVCTPDQKSCAPEDAVTACSGLADDTPCIAGGLGGVCDDGACRVIICGNGRVDPTEVCDDGNVDALDGCSPTCRSDESCGNAIIDPGEGCDCGAADKIAAVCAHENSNAPDAECREDCTPHGCGDGFVEGVEQCEAGVALAATCGDYGFYKGSLGCNSVCQFDTKMCAERCGDKTPNGNEACDGTPPTATCVEYGYDAGALGCTSFCTPDVSKCRSFGWQRYPFGATGYSVVWGASSTDVWAAGAGGAALRWDGATWTSAQIGGLASDTYVWAMWGTGSSNIYAVHDEGISRYDGTSWTNVLSTTGLYGISGAGPSFVIAVGEAGVIQLWNGSSWAPMTSNTTASIFGVAVVSTTEAYAVGVLDLGTYQRGIVLRWNGSDWTELPSPRSRTYNSVWARANELYVGGPDSVLHWVGGQWNTVPLCVRGGGAAAIVGSSPDDLYIMFWDDYVEHFDGKRWTSMQPDTRFFAGIWASGDGSVFVAGEQVTRYLGSEWSTLNPDPPHLLAVGGSSATALFAVGEGSTILRSTADRWQRVPGELVGTLRGASRNIIVGDAGQIGTFDGARVVAIDTDTREQLNGVWAASDTDAWAVGAKGTIVHYTGGATASVVASGTTSTLYGVFGFASDDVYAVGGGGVMLHWNGSDWSPFASGTTVTLYGVWGATPTDLWIVGDAGTARRWNGSGWTAMTPPTQYPLKAIYGTSATDISIVGHTFTLPEFTVRLRWNGQWVQELATQQLLSVGGAGNTVCEVGNGLTLDCRTANSSAWLFQIPDLTNTVINNYFSDAVAVTPADLYAFNSGTTYYFDGVLWTRVNVVGTTAFGTSASNVFVASSTTLRRFDGTTWTPTTMPFSVQALGGTASDDIWAVGAGGGISHFDDVQWTTQTSNTSASLDDVWAASKTDAFAVGAGGTIVHWNGTSWQPMTSNVSVHLLDVWGSSGTDVFALGTGGTIIHWNGTSWSPLDINATQMSAGATVALNGITGSAADDVFAFGDAGTLLHYDGTTWTAVSVPTKNNIRAADIMGNTLVILAHVAGVPVYQLQRDAPW